MGWAGFFWFSDSCCFSLYFSRPGHSWFSGRRCSEQNSMPQNLQVNGNSSNFFLQNEHFSSDMIYIEFIEFYIDCVFVFLINMFAFYFP